MTPAALRALLRDCFTASLRRVGLRGRVAQALASADIEPPAHVLAVGKAAPAMLAGAVEALGKHVIDALLITTDGTDVPRMPTCCRVLRAAHPVPDARSLHAAHEAMLFASHATQGTFVVLVSGGTSSLLCSPPVGVSLADFQSLMLSLNARALPIRDLNTLRRHLSRVHGGALAAASFTRVFSAIASDVIDGEPHDVGSGPACSDPTTIGDAAAVLREALPSGVSQRWIPLLRETLKPSEENALRMAARVVVHPKVFADIVRDELANRGMVARSASLPHLRAESLVAHLVHIAEALQPGHALALTCEPTLTLPSNPGKGGRAGWVALASMLQLPIDVALLCGATDGVDGSSDAAGACVSGDLHAPAMTARHKHALDRRDDAAIHEVLGTHLPGHPAGLNLTDVYVVARTLAG